MNTILHISKYYYPDLGGIESVARFLAENLGNYRNEVVCFATDKSIGINYVGGVTVHRVPVQFSFMSQDVSFGYYYHLKKIFKATNPTMVVLHCPNPFLYPIVQSLVPSNVRLVLLWHSDILSKGIMYKLIKPFEKRIMDRADHIIATSQSYADHSVCLQPYINKVRILQNTVNNQLFDPRSGDKKIIAKIRKRYDNRKIVFFVGRHIPYKGLDRLIEAEKYVKSDCVFVIAGIGPLTNEMMRKAAGQSRIHFVGRLSDDDLRCHLYAADVFGFPSVYKAEAFGVALAEAMYCKAVPVTFTIKGSGVNWVSLNGVTGEEVPLDDVKAYAEAIDRLLSDDALRTQYANAAHERAERLFKESIVASFANDLFQELENNK